MTKCIKPNFWGKHTKVKDLEIQRPFRIPIDPFRRGTHHEMANPGPDWNRCYLVISPCLLVQKKQQTDRLYSHV